MARQQLLQARASGWIKAWCLNLEVHPHTCWKGLGMWEGVGDTHTNPDKLPCPNRRLPGKPTGAAVA